MMGEKYNLLRGFLTATGLILPAPIVVTVSQATFLLQDDQLMRALAVLAVGLLIQLLTTGCFAICLWLLSQSKSFSELNESEPDSSEQ